MCRSDVPQALSHVPPCVFLSVRWGGQCFSRQFNDLQVLSHLSHLFFPCAYARVLFFSTVFSVPFIYISMWSGGIGGIVYG